MSQLTEQIQLFEKLILDLAISKLDKLIELGHMPGGHNGPYYDPETPVRNTAHWTTIFAYCYKKTADEKYLNAVKTCAKYLLSKKARPMGATFYCRTNPKKDFSNGTIGQAWAIEGLVAAYKATKQQIYLETAREVFLLHPFDEKYNLWKVVNVDGSIREFDMTFNHQLWFAASGTILLAELPDPEIKRQCQLFFDALPKKMLRTYNSGLIKHAVRNSETLKEKLKNILDWSTNKLRALKSGKDLKYKENGYHLFNLYAFAIVKQHYGNIEFFKMDKFQKALSYCFSTPLHDALEKECRSRDINKMPKVTSDKINIYGYSYNAPGFELPYIAKVFNSELDDQSVLISQVIKNQLEYTFNQQQQSFNLQTEDQETLNARIYEYVRGLDY
ncbi:hypothetical protein QX776_17680 [Alteromonadaceae bacterium BrNp21-10]|nr:hypothetical protein [Alteromonadaceae bacterium BrNp21-10]